MAKELMQKDLPKKLMIYLIECINRFKGLNLALLIISQQSP